MTERKLFYVDVTATYFQGQSGGIPRVVRKYVEAFDAHPDLTVVCFVHAGGEFYAVPKHAIKEPRRVARIVRQLRAAFGIRNYRHLPLYAAALAVWEGWNSLQLRLYSLAGAATVVPPFEVGDTILLPYVPRRSSFNTLMERRNKGTLIAALLHDVFPIQYPQYFIPEFRDVFVRGLNAQISVSDIVIAVSRNTAASVSLYLADRGIRKPVDFAYLGSDVQERSVQPAGTSGPPTLLSVGTLEPRKNYAYALALCDRLWAMGHDFRYVIVGGVEPSWSAITRMVRSHPEFGRKLFHRDAANDADLMAAYESSSFLLIASVDEGFGLPVMEAWRYGLPVICSDIAIFRELCPQANFIPLDDVPAAAAAVGLLLGQAAQAKRDAVAAAHPPGLVSWQDSARRMRAILDTARHRRDGAEPPS